MSIRNQEVVYRINKYADFPQESRSFFLDSGIVPVIDWDMIRGYDSVYTLPGSELITGVGWYECFQVPIGKRYRVKKLTVSSGKAGNKFSNSLYLRVQGNIIYLRPDEINGLAYGAADRIYLEFKIPLELRPRSVLAAYLGVKGDADSQIEVKMWGTVTDDY